MPSLGSFLLLHKLHDMMCQSMYVGIYLTDLSAQCNKTFLVIEKKSVQYAVNAC